MVAALNTLAAKSARSLLKINVWKVVDGIDNNVLRTSGEAGMTLRATGGKFFFRPWPRWPDSNRCLIAPISAKESPSWLMCFHSIITDRDVRVCVVKSLSDLLLRKSGAWGGNFSDKTLDWWKYAKGVSRMREICLLSHHGGISWLNYLEIWWKWWEIDPFCLICFLSCM